MFQNQNEIKKYAGEIAEWLVSPNYILSDGFLTRGILNGKKMPDNEVDDLGDYLPLLFLFGKKDFCKNHIRLLCSYLNKGILPTRQKRRGFYFTSTYEHSDLLLGLLDYCELVQNDKIKQLLKFVLDSVIKKFRIGELAFSYFIPSFGISIPIFDTQDGMYIEILNQAAEILRDKKYSQKSWQLFESMAKLPFFKKYGLFPFYAPSPYFIAPLHLVFPLLKNHFKEVVTMKNNTNTIFAFLDLFRRTGENPVKQAIYKWFESFQEHLLDKEGFVFDKLYEKDGRDGLKKITGVGETIAERVEEYLKTGKIRYYQELKKKTPIATRCGFTLWKKISRRW